MKKNRGKLKKMDVHKIVPKSAKKGTVPGTIAYVGKERSDDVRIDVIEYNETNIIETKLDNPHKISDLLNTPSIKWIRVTGVHDTDLLNQIGEIFAINNLDLEDIANTTQRPRIEERFEYIFLIFKLLQIDPETNDITIEQVSVVLGKNYVISFHETHPTIFEPLRQRILSGKGRILRMQSDYLAFTIADVVIDQYFTLLDDVGDMIENTEEELIFEPGKSSQEAIYRLKRRLIYVKKTIWPVRELITKLQRSDNPLLTKESRIYFSNIYDHTVQIIETIESLREITSGMMDLYLSTVSNKMNEIMKVLTIYSALFIPLTFVAGVYGMNFNYLPELSWHWGYYMFWGICLVLTIFMVIYFKRKKWL